MGSIASCLAKAGKAIPPARRQAILDRVPTNFRLSTSAEAVASALASIDAEIASVEARLPAAPSSRRQGGGHPQTVMGSRLLAHISRALGGLDPAWIADFSMRVETSKRGKDGRLITQWRNPPIPGVGLLFRRGGTQDLEELSRLMEDHGYLAPGTTDSDGKGAGEQAISMIRAALSRDEPQTLDEQIAAVQAADEQARKDYYEALAAEAAAEAEAEREAIMAEAGMSQAQADALEDDALSSAAGSTDTGALMRALGFTEQEIADELAQQEAQRRQEAGASRTGADAGEAARPVREARDAPPRADAEEGLTLRVQTREDLQARADREEAARLADAAEQRRLADKAKADAQRDEFVLTGSDRPADVAAAAGQMDIFGAPAAAPAQQPEAPAAPQAESTDDQLRDDLRAKRAARPKADGVTRAQAGGQLGVNGEWYEGGQILPTSEDTVKGEQTRPSGPRNEPAPAPAEAAAPAVDTSVPLAPEQVLAGAGLSVAENTSRAGKRFWTVTGDTRRHEALLDALGFAKPFKMGGKWGRSVFDADPTERLVAALQGAPAQPGEAAGAAPEPKPSLPADEAAIVLRQFKVEVSGSNGAWIVTGKTFDIKDVIRATGGRWNGQAWSFTEDPTGTLAAALKERGSPGADGDNAGTGESDAEIERRREFRQREDAAADERATASDAAGLVSAETRALIERGAKFNIPAQILAEQVEDIGFIVGAHAAGKPLFLLANEAGTGKTMVLGGAIRELRARGETRFVYVTMNTDLIAQIKRDLADYGVHDVDFHTYSELSAKGFDTAGAVLIFDEAHNVKNVGAETARANKAQDLIAASKMTLFASATLFENPVEARYLAPTGVFDSVGGFNEWAKMYGASVKTRKFYNPNIGREQTEEIIYWAGGSAKKKDAAAARAWLFKKGVMTQRAMRIQPEMTDVQFKRAPVAQRWVEMYQRVTDAYDAAEDAWRDESGNSRDYKITSEIARHRENTIKRILEAGKVPFAIAQAKSLLAAGRNVVIFVETKADRTLGMWRRSEHFKDDKLYSFAQMQEMMDDWRRERDWAMANKEKAPPRPFAEFIYEIGRFFDAAGIHYELPSTADDITAALGPENVAVYTGAISNATAGKNKADFMSGRKSVLVATMAKGGTGLSLHDTVGNRPTTQLNINLPWKATGVDQVSARVARYGLASKAEVRWLFASNIPWESQKLAPRVGARMRDMGAMVKGLELKAAEALAGEFDFEGDLDVKGGSAIGVSDVPDEVDTYERAERMERLRRKADDTSHGFFETPYPLAALMGRVGGVRPGTRLLEPSAGRGNLVRLLPGGVKITAVELRDDNRQALQRLVPDATVIAGDFLQTDFGPRPSASLQDQGSKFDTVLMNPPFERLAGVGAQDVAHVQRAFGMLAPDGRLVAIMGEGAFFRDSPQERAFRQWLDDVGATVVQMPEGAFKQSGTGVRTRMIVVDKGGESGRTDLNLSDLGADALRDIERQIPSRAAVALAESKLPEAQPAAAKQELAAAPAVTVTKPAAAEIVQDAETIPPAKLDAITIEAGEETVEQEEAELTHIADVGAKIGGARKDTAKALGSRIQLEEDKRPGWARKYTAMPVSGQVSLASLMSGKRDPVTPDTPGAKWALFIGKSPFMQRIGRFEFDTEQAAVDFIPIAEVGRKHRATAYREDGKLLWGIFRKMGDRKRALVKGGFATEAEAMAELATNPVPIIEHKFKFPERPWLDRVQRVGVSRRTGSVSAEEFQATFGFRGVEFGKWNMAGDGQAVLNHAFDGFMDLADVLGVPPRALSLNGELAVAFGARGHGGKGFVDSSAAHYEPEYEVINLTKEQGAGSLAHEWFHALDHYLARLDNAAPRGFTTNERGDRVRIVSKKAGGDNLTSARALRPEARKELVAAFREVVDAFHGVPTQVPVNVKFAEKYLKDAKESLDYRLADLRRSLIDGKYNRGNKKATPEQLAKWDALAERLRRGDIGEGVYIDPRGEVGARQARITSARESARVIVDMNAIYKAVVGRAFDKTGYDSLGARIKFDANAIRERTTALATAQRRAAAGETDTVTKSSEFYAAAREIDEGRVSAYWSTPHEMGARAFEAYIMDRIAERAGRSDYLVYGAENRFYALFGMAPYPDGSERQAINAAFDKLFRTIQTKADDAGNVAMFSRGQGSGIALRDARAVVAAIRAANPRAPNIILHDSVEDLPSAYSELREFIYQEGAQEDVEGAYHDGEIHVFPAHIASVERMLFVVGKHEIRHHGLRALFGPGMDVALLAIYNTNDAVRVAADAKLSSAHADSKVMATEEALADMPTEQVQKLTGWGRVVATVRRWLRGVAQRLRQAGFAALAAKIEPEAWTDADVAALLLRAEEVSRTGGASFAPGGTVLSDQGRQPSSFGDTERAYGGRDAYARAKAAGRTKLTYGQWVQVRTPEFKNWFGDWEALRAQQRLDAMEPVDVRVPDDWLRLDKGSLRQRVAEQLDLAVKAKAEIVHPEIGPIRVGLRGVKKTISESPDPAKLLIVADLGAVLPQAVVGEAKLGDRVGVIARENLYAKVRVGSTEMVAVIALNRQADGRWYYNTVVVTDSQKEVDPGAYASPRSGSAAIPLGETLLTGVDAFVRRPFLRVNPTTVSKVTDPETGEPLVVYHGTHADFSKFDASLPTKVPNEQKGLWFAERPQATQQVTGSGAGDVFDGFNIMPSYLRMVGPEDGEIYGKRGDRFLAVRRPEQIKSAVGNRGTFDPNELDIRLSRAGTAATQPRTAQDLLDATGGAFNFNRLGQTRQDRVRAVLDGARPFWLGALTRDQIADIYGGEIDSVREYDQLTRAMENQRQSMAQEAEALYERWAKIPAAVNERLARVMLDSTVAQVHPDREAPPRDATADQVQEHTRVRREYLLLTKDAREMYAEVRDFHAATLDKLRKALEGRLERQIENASERAALLTDLRMRFDDYLKGGPYFPLHRFGDFLVIGERADGQRVVAAYENAGEQQMAARELQRDGFTVKLRMAKAYQRSLDGSAGKFIGDVLEAIERADMTEASFNGSTTDLKAKLLDDLNQLFIRAMPDLSYRKHFTHRKNVPGFSADVMRGFASSAFHAASHIARLNHGDRMTFALEDAYKQVEMAGEGDFTQATQVLEEISKRHEAMLNPSSHPLSNLATQAGFVMYLGLSPAAGLINMLQVPMVALPYIGARYGFGRATAALTKAYADIMGAPANRRSGFNAAQSLKLSEIERAAMTTLQDEGVIDLTQAHDLAAATDRDVGNQARSRASFAIARAMRIVGWTFHVPEVMNRQVTALMAYRLATEAGKTNEAALDEAREAIKRTQFDYSSSNRARWMQGDVARVILQFKQFAQNMTYFLGRAAYQALKGEDADVKRIARRQIIATFAVTGAMAGTMGLPGVGMLGALLSALASAMGDDDEPFDWKAEYRNALADAFGKEVGEVIAKGVPRALMPWWDISNRVSLADLWWRDAGREGQNPREAFAADMTNILGPTAGTIMGWYTASDHMARGQYSKAVESIVPKFIRDPIKAYREGTHGVTSYIGEPLMETTLTEDVGRVLGFAPARASEMYEGRAAVMNAKTALDEKRQNLLSRLVKARLDGDAETATEIASSVVEFNRRNPQFAIDADAVSRAIRNKQRNRALTYDGVMVPRGKDYLRERGRFAEVD